METMGLMSAFIVAMCVQTSTWPLRGNTSSPYIFIYKRGSLREKKLSPLTPKEVLVLFINCHGDDGHFNYHGNTYCWVYGRSHMLTIYMSINFF